MHDHPVAGAQAFAHLHATLQIGAAEAHRHEDERTLAEGPDADLLAAALDGGVGQHRAGLGRRQLQRHLGQLAERNPRGHLLERHLGDALFRHAVGEQLQALHLAGQRPRRIRAQRDFGGQPRGEAGRAPLVEAHLHPQAGRIDQPHHGLAGDDGRARLGVARRHHAVGGRDEADVLPLLAHAVALGAQARAVLSRRGEVRFGGGQRGIRRSPLLQPGLDDAGADELLLAELGIAARVDRRHLAARQRIAPLRLGGGGRAGGAGDRGIERDHALVEVHRVHLRQELAGLHRLADIDRHPEHAAGGGRPDEIGAARLHRADAEQRRRDAGLLHLHHGDAGRGEGAGAHDDEHERTEQDDAEQDQPGAAKRQGFELHDGSRMALR